MFQVQAVGIGIVGYRVYRGSGRTQQDAKRIRRGFMAEIGTEDLNFSRTLHMVYPKISRAILAATL